MFFLTSIHSKIFKNSNRDRNRENRKGNVRRVTLIPEDFRGPSFLFFLFSLSVFFPIIDFAFFSSRHISIFCRMEFWFNERGRKKAGKKRFRCVPKDIVLLARRAGRNYKESPFTDSFRYCSHCANITGLYTHVEKCYIGGRVMLGFCEYNKYKSIWYNNIDSY